MRMKIFKAAVFSFLISVSSFAYDNLFIFGDSLSDVGNAPNTQDLNLNGRWSNGYVWCEYLAQKLNVNTAGASKNYSDGDKFANGNINFAYGGGMTSWGTTSIAGILSVDEQIYGEKGPLGNVKDATLGFDRYETNFGKDDLVAVWAGANNLFFAGTILIKEDYVGTAKKAANDMLSNLSHLIDKGAENILILNLPDIGLTPCYKDSETDRANASLFSETFNDTLAKGLKILMLANADIDFICIDMYSMFNEILAEPAAYGFDFTTTCLLDAYNNENLPSEYEAAQYLFYDDVHPTTAGHKMLADLIYAQIIPEPSTYAICFGFFALSLAILRKKFLKKI